MRGICIESGHYGVRIRDRCPSRAESPQSPRNQGCSAAPPPSPTQGYGDKAWMRGICIESGQSGVRMRDRDRAVRRFSAEGPAERPGPRFPPMPPGPDPARPRPRVAAIRRGCGVFVIESGHYGVRIRDRCPAVRQFSGWFLRILVAASQAAPFRGPTVSRDSSSR